MAGAGRNLSYEDICRDLEHSYPHVDRGVVRLILTLLPEWSLDEERIRPRIPTSGRYVPNSIRRPSEPGEYWVVNDKNPSTGSPVRGTYDGSVWTVDGDDLGLYFWESESY